MNEALSLFSPTLRMQKEASGVGWQSPRPQVRGWPTGGEKSGLLGSGWTHAAPPSPLQSTQALFSRPVLDPAPTPQGLCRGHAHCWASNPGPTIPGWSRSSLLHAPWLSSLGLPRGLLTRAAALRQQPAKGQSRGRGGCGRLWSPSSPRPSAPETTEARSPPPEPRMPPSAPAPQRLGPGGFLTSLQALPRWPIGLRDGASAWEDGGKDRLQELPGTSPSLPQAPPALTLQKPPASKSSKGNRNKTRLSDFNRGCGQGVEG